MRKIFLVALLSVIGMTAPGFAHSQTMSAVLVTSTGEPAVGIRVYGSNECKYCCPCKPEESKTNEEGLFSLSSPGKAVHIRDKSYRPSSIVVNTSPSNKRLPRVLEDAEFSNWKVPLCSGVDKERINIELVFNFLPPKGVKGRWEHGFDTYQHRIRYRKSPYYLRLDGGPNLGGRDPDDGLLAMSTLFEERWVVDPGGIIGVDAKGQLPNGHVWRSVGLMGVAIARYNDIPPEVAEFFDGIIDSLCVAVPPEK